MLTIPEGGAPYFDDSFPLDLRSFDPFAIPLASSNPGSIYPPIVIHTDYGSLVTGEKPAVPGEVLHIYLTGCGPVTIPVPTGVPTPLSPLSWVSTPVSVVGTPGNHPPLQVSFFGLAPGLTGVWQMDVAVPMTWSMPALFVTINGWSLNGIPVHTGQ